MELAGCAPRLYAPVLEILEQMGCGVVRRSDAAVITRFGRLYGPGRVFTGAYPALATDAAPLLAAALDTARRVGLCVTENDLMTPRKSVTALLGLSDHPVKGHLAGCGHCVLNTRCEYRKRGKTCASE